MVGVLNDAGQNVSRGGLDHSQSTLFELAVVPWSIMMDAKGYAHVSKHARTKNVI
jgi:hypothetical protein